MKNAQKVSTSRLFRKALIYFLVYCMVFNTSILFALNPADLNSSTGLDPLVTWGDHTILQTDNGAILNWNNFNTSDIQSVTFNQPSITSAVLNRVSGAATQFNGDLFANGNVFIVNPAGIYFGATSSVNVNQLVASTLDIADEDFLAGKYEFIAGDGVVGGITNNSRIEVTTIATTMIAAG